MAPRIIYEPPTNWPGYDLDEEDDLPCLPYNTPEGPPQHVEEGETRLAVFDDLTEEEQQILDEQGEGEKTLSIQHLLVRICFKDGRNLVAFGDDIYRRQGNHWVKVPRVELVKQALSWMQKRTPSAYSNRNAVDAVNCLVNSVTLTSDDVDHRVNPDGFINCANGILKIEPGNVQLIPHEHPSVKDLIFPDKPVLTYHPEADRVEALRLLECLGDGTSRQVWLRVIGSILNRNAVKMTQGRVPALISPATGGSNGKSVLDDIITLLIGHSAVSTINLQGFNVSGDADVKNELHRLRGKRYNCPAESSVVGFRIDSLEELKKAITGEEMSSRRNRQDSVAFRSRAGHHYSLNSVPCVNFTDPAIRTRFRALRWPFTFLANPDPNDPSQRKVDPRFNYHLSQEARTFVVETVLPGLLLELIDGFNAAVADGFPIDESVQIFTSLRQQTDHVREFLDDFDVLPKQAGVSEAINGQQLYAYYQGFMLFHGEANIDHSFQFNDRGHGFDAPHKSQRKLVAHLRDHCGVKVTKPNAATAEAAGIKRIDHLWLKPKPDMPYQPYKSSFDF